MGKNKIDCYLSYLPKDGDYVTNPILMYSSWTSVDENINLIKENDPRTTIHNQIVFNQINGMAMMLNKRLVSLWKYSNIGVHDSYVALLAFATGKVIYIPKSTILWRRQTQSESLNNYGRGYGLGAFWKMINTSFDRTEDIITNYQELIMPEMFNYYIHFIQLRDSRFINRFKLLLTLKLRRNSIIETIAMNILLLTNLGRIQ